MPAWIYVVAAAAVLTVAWYGWARRWLHSWRYSWARARHMVDLTQTEAVPGAEYGSMVLDEERTVTWDPPAYLLAAPVDPEPWRARTLAELSPEALERLRGPEQPQELTRSPGNENRDRDADSGAGDSLALAPAPDPDWLEAQLAILFDWVRQVHATEVPA